MLYKNHVQTLIAKVDEQSSLFDWNQYRIGYFYKKNKIKSLNNEDTLFLLTQKNQIIAGVSDGAGGHPKGDEAAYLAAIETLNFFDVNNSESTRVMDLIETINKKICDLKVGAHTTFSLLTINENIFRSYSIGDSEIICWNSKGSEVYSNIPQTNVGYSIEAGYIKQNESLDDPDRYLVNNMLGDSVLRVEASSKIQIKKGYTLLIGSDGLFDNLSHEELGRLIAKGNFKKSFQDLCSICKQQEEGVWKKDDDVSFIAIRKIIA